MKQKLTKKAIDALRPEARDYKVWDSEISGFGVKVTPRGRKVYIVRYRTVNGIQRQYTIGIHGSPHTTEQARQQAKDVLHKATHGQDPQAKKVAERRREGVTTFEQAVDRFMRRYASKQNRSWRETERLIRHDALPAWRGKPVKNISGDDVLDVIERVSDRGAYTTANNLFAALRKLFNWLVENHAIDASPMAGMKKPHKPTERRRHLSDDEVLTFWQSTEELGWPFGPFLQLLLLTAQRENELANMRWGDVDTSNALWTIPAERAKNDREHKVPLSPQALDVLRTLPAGHDLVFTTTGTTPISGFSKAKRRLDNLMEVRLASRTYNDAGAALEPWVLHDLRRTATTHMAEMEFPPHVVDRILNHSQGTIRGVAAVYNQYAYLEQRRVALIAWGNKIETLVQGSDTANVTSIWSKSTAKASLQ